MSRARRVAVAGVTFVLTASIAGVSSAAINHQTQNPGNSFSAGTVQLEDDDTGPLFALSGLTPSSSPTPRCIGVRYPGDLNAQVRLYAASSGGLAPYINLKIERGSATWGTSPSCASFSPDGVDYIGRGNGVIYDGLLSSLPSSWSGGIQDPPGSQPETWSTAEPHAYRLTVTVNNDPQAQGQSAQVDFTWEAREL